MGFAAYRTIAYDGASEEAKSAAALEEDGYRKAINLIDGSIQLAPENKSAFEGYKTDLQAIQEVIKDVIALGLKNENDAATKEMVKGDGLIAKLSKEITQLNDASAKAVSAKTEETAAKSRSTIITTVVIGVVGLAVCLGLGIWLAMARIANPLRRLGDRMNTLAVGNFDIDIEGSERKDEIGQMAKTVLVFRDAGKEKVRLEAPSGRAAQGSRGAAAEGRGGAPAQCRVAGRRGRRAGAGRQGARRRSWQNVRGRPDDTPGCRVHRGLSADQGRFQCDDREAAGNHRIDRRVHARGDQRLGGDLDQHHRPVAAHRGTGGEPGGNLGFDGRDRRYGEEKRRKRATGQ